MGAAVIVSVSVGAVISTLALTDGAGDVSTGALHAVNASNPMASIPPSFLMPGVYRTPPTR
ncbi:hypothetical protein ART_0167 [Arthrobacter sp. PAMC 25486]|nr:hypothetical protein ART_0167 [Arthrobacter sp. PAMC 25486]